MRTAASSEGHIVLPAEFRRRDGIRPGQEFDIEPRGRGDYPIIRRPATPNEGLVDWLLACPQKSYFVPVEASFVLRS